MKRKEKEELNVADPKQLHGFATSWESEKRNERLAEKSGTEEDKLQSRLLSRSRMSDYTSMSGLCTQTGCDREKLDVLLLKELVDNALDSNPQRPVIHVSFRQCNEQFFTLTVEDNGKGIEESVVRKILDFDSFSSTKFHYKLPTRGALGNAFKCIAGLPYAVAIERGKLIPYPLVSIHSLNYKHSIMLEAKKPEQIAIARIRSRRYGMGRKGTKISVNVPPYEENWCKKREYIDLIDGYEIFNPNATFTLSYLSCQDVEYPSVSSRYNGYQGASSIHWYSFAEFKQLVEAIAWGIMAGDKDITLTQFIKQFRGLTSDEKATSILAELGNQGLKHLSQLTIEPDLVNHLYGKMREYSTVPNSDVLGKIGRKQIFERFRELYGPIIMEKYEIRKGTYSDGEASIPYVLEVALGILEENIGLQVYAGINHSPCLTNPFEGYRIAWSDERGKERNARIVHGVLESYEIDSKQPVVLAIHLICPNIKYENYGKARINIIPFIKDIGQTLTSVCRFYPRYRRRKGKSKGRTSNARTLLVEELLRRKQLLEQDGKVPQTEKMTQQGIYYKIRSQMGGEIDIARDSFITALRNACIEMGGDLSFREQLGIVAAERAQLYFRGQVSPISWDRIEDLATRGSDVILIEKEGVCEVLEPYAAKRGIALLNSRGFATDYAKQLLSLSQKWKGNIFLLTDFDASGLLMALKVLEGQIPRIGVDLEMLQNLGLSREKLQETYDNKIGSAPPKHLKALSPEIQEQVKSKRIEIDAVLAAIGPERFWNYIERKIMEWAPTRDMNRSIDLTIKLPQEIAEPIGIIKEFLQSTASEKQQEIMRILKEWKEGFLDVEAKEHELQDQMLAEIRKDNRVQELIKQLSTIAEAIPKKGIENT